MDDQQLETMIEAMRRRVEALEERCARESAPDPVSCAMLQELETGLEKLRGQSERLLCAQKRLEDEGQRYRELFELAPDGYLVTDPVGTIREANRKAAAMLGVPRESLAGKALTVYVASQRRGEFTTLLGRLIKDGRITEWEVELQPRGGGRMVALVTAVTARDALGNAVGVHWMLRDVTDRHQAKAASQRYVNRLEVLRHMDLAMLTATSLKHTAELALEYLWRLVPCCRASVGLIDQRKGEMTIVAVLVNGTTVIPEGATMPIDTSEATMLLGQWRIIEDTYALDSPTPWVRAMRDEGVRTIMNVPLMVQGELVGSLNLGLEQPDQLGTEDREVVQEVADRRLVARELHDQVGQNLSALSLSLSALREQVRTLPEEAAVLFCQRIDDALSLVREAAVRTRDIMADLRPPVLDDYGLMAALRWHAEGLRRRTSLSVTLQGKEPEPRLPAPVEIALFRIAQEALMNVAKHAGTNEAWVTLETDEMTVRLVVADTGVGFDPAEITEQEGHAGWGLITIKERAEAVGGHIRVESQPEQGTRVTVEVPR
jgi:PAS domain S-box-containing protein